MRLGELFETTLMEAPGDESNGVKLMMSPADLYDMMGKPYPVKPGPNGNDITPPGFFDKKERIVTPEIAKAHAEWVDGGRLPGLIKKDGNTVAYNENSTLEDLSWQFLAGGAELLNTWIKGGSVVSDDVFNNVSPAGAANKRFGDGKGISNIKSSTLSGYERGQEFWGDKVVEWFESKTDQSFKDNMNYTSGAVNTFNDVRDLFMGGTGFNIEGAAGIMIGELPSEIVDLTLMITTGPLAGMAASGALNALEAGGAAAQSITDRVNVAYDKGVLQMTPQFQMYLDAAVMQLMDENKDSPLSKDELAEQANDMARKQAIDMSINNAFYKVAVTGGVIDAIQNRILYRGPIKGNFLKDAVLKGVAGTTGEGVSGYLEQVFENVGIMDGAGNITYATEGAFNAAYNEMLAAQSGNVLATTADAAVRAKGGLAALRKFIMGGSRDPKAIIDIMAMDSNTLINQIETVDPVTGRRKFAIAEMIKKRLMTEDQLTASQKRKLSRTGRVRIDGKNYTAKEIRENTENVELVGLLDDVEIDPKENTSRVNLNSEEEARRLAQLLGITVDGKKVKKNTDINKVLAAIENVRKIDVAIEGRSTLEPPIWSDLNDRQKMQYWKEGKVEFVGDPERGNQTWTRKQIMFNSRRMQDDIPAEVANLPDNVNKRPDINDADYESMAGRLRVAQQTLDSYKIKAERDLAAEQKAWDNKYADDPTSAPDPRPTKQNNEKYQGLMRIANGQAGPGVVAKQTIDTIKKEIKEDAKAWDAEFGETHETDGTAKADAKIFSQAEASRIKAEKQREAAEAKKKALEELAQNENVSNSDTAEAPHVPDVNNTSAESNDLSRLHYIASAKQRIAEGDMEPETLEAFLDKSDESFPGISKEIMSDEARANYKKVDLRDSAKEETVGNKVKPSDVVANTRPPEGTVVTIDNQPYVWLGVEDGKGGMWAKVKEDGSRGSTSHQNHKRLMQTWIDSTLNKDRPSNLTTPTTEGEPNIEKRDAQKEKQKAWQDALDAYNPDENDVGFLVPPASEQDARVKNMKVPQSVQQDFADVLATNNAIKVKRFLDSLPPAQAGKLRYDYNQGDFDVRPSNLDSDPIQPPDVQTTVTQPGGDTSSDTSGQTGTIDKDAVTTTTTAPPLDDPQAGLDDFKRKDKNPTKPGVQTTLPNDPPPGTNVSPEIDAIVNDPENDQNLLPNTAKITEPQANQPIRFVPQTKLTPDQRDALGGYGKYAPGQKTATDTPDAGIDVKDKDPNKAGIQTEPPSDTTTDTAQDNQAQADDAMGTPSVDTTTDVKVDTDTVTPGIVNPAIAGTTALAVTTDKNKKRQQQLQKNRKTDKTGVMRKGAPFFGAGDDEPDQSDLMKFFPAKYQDPLDLDKYKGAVKRSMSGRKPAKQ